LFMAERALSRKGLKAISIACHPNARPWMQPLPVIENLKGKRRMIFEVES
jgi:hypothetical protein